MVMAQAILGRTLPCTADRELAEARLICGREISSGRWCVLRNGGSGRGLRVMFCSLSELDAREQFDKVRRRMRQGSVLLLGPDAALHGYASEPMARRRW